MHAFQIIGRGDVTRGKAGSDEVSATYRISATAVDTGGCDEPVIYASSVIHCSVESNVYSVVMWLAKFAFSYPQAEKLQFLRTLLRATTTTQNLLAALLYALGPGPHAGAPHAGPSPGNSEKVKQ